MSETNSTDDYQIPSSGFFIAMITFASLCIIVGIIGNIGVIAYNIFMNHSKTPTTYFVVNLAISDVIVCLTLFPPWLVEFVSILKNTLIMKHRLFCKIEMTTTFTCIALSIGNLLAINVDRCIFITKPLKYPSIMTWKRAYIFVAVIWILAISNAKLTFFNTEELSGRRLICYITKPERNILNFINIYLPSAGLLYLNYKIYKAAKNQKRKIRNGNFDPTNDATQSVRQNPGIPERKEQLRQLKIIKTFSIILGAFYCCISPIAILSLVSLEICKRPNCIPISVTVAAIILTGANSAINPFIYSSRNKEYKIAYRQLFSRLFRNN